MENLWNDAIPYWNEEFIEADETAVRKPTITAYPANSKGAVIISGCSQSVLLHLWLNTELHRTNIRQK